MNTITLGYPKREASFLGLGFAETVDQLDLASPYQDEELMNIFKKTSQRSNERQPFFETAKAVQFINKSTRPEITLFRNEFLMAVVQNQFNISGRLRYAYLSDQDARPRKMALDALEKLRKIKDKVEQLYHHAGGSKSSFRKAILWGKGNQLENYVVVRGNELTDNLYADHKEYNIIQGHGINNDFNFNTGASTLSINTVTAIAEILRQVKGLFMFDPKAARDFQYEGNSMENSEPVSDFMRPEQSASSSISLSGDGDTIIDTANNAVNRESAGQHKSILMQQNVVERTVGWISHNPGKSLLIAGALAGGTVLVKRYLEQRKPIRSREINGRAIYTASRERQIKKANKIKETSQELS